MSNVISILNDLIAISKDGEEGFKKVAAEITSEQLKSTFLDRARSCAEAATELQKYVDKLGGTPADSGSILGALHRGWIDIKSAIVARDNHAILEECERGEDAAKTAYAKALEGELPSELRSLLQKHFEGVKKNYDMVVRLKNEYAGEGK